MLGETPSQEEINAVKVKLALLRAIGWTHRISSRPKRDLVVDLWHPKIGLCRGIGRSWFLAWASAMRMARLATRYQMQNK